jgi:TonB family protein
LAGILAVAGNVAAQPAIPLGDLPGVPVMPPRQRAAPQADYPVGATGDSVVVLLVVVALDGKVDDVKATSGEEPFVTAAIAAARTWTFNPATRDGRPIAARIKMEVAFHEPTPAEPTPEVGPVFVPGGASAHAHEPVEEVTVRGLRPAPGTTSLGRAEVRQLPGAFGDPFRAIESLAWREHRSPFKAHFGGKPGATVVVRTGFWPVSGASDRGRVRTFGAFCASRTNPSYAAHLR